MPAYWLCEQIPATRDGALRCGLVSLKQTIAALVTAVENAPPAIRLIEVPQIRNAILASSAGRESGKINRRRQS